MMPPRDSLRCRFRRRRCFAAIFRRLRHYGRLRHHYFREDTLSFRQNIFVTARSHVFADTTMISYARYARLSPIFFAAGVAIFASQSHVRGALRQIDAAD